MRYHGILILAALAFLVGCKSTSATKSKTSTASVYSEDLSKLRPDLRTEEQRTNLDTSSVAYQGGDKGQLKGHIATELDSIDQMLIAQNHSERYVEGFTIQIYTGIDRQEAQDAVNRVNQLFPHLDPEMRYYQPTYKVKVGRYLNKLRAHEVLQSLKSQFPLALLIPEKIRINYD